MAAAAVTAIPSLEMVFPREDKEPVFVDVVINAFNNLLAIVCHVLPKITVILPVDTGVVAELFPSEHTSDRMS